MLEKAEGARRLGFVPLSLGAFACSYGLVSLVLASWPAWPAASAGLLALATATLPGHALARGGGAFLGAAGLVIGALRIAALWGVVTLGS